MKVVVISLALFIFLKGPEYYNNYIEIQHKKIKNSVSGIYHNPIEKLGIKFPDVVAAQIILETNWLTSIIYKENGNLFGMKESSRSWDVGSNRGHANYKTKIYHTHIDITTPELRSLMDYKDWQEMRFRQLKEKNMHIPSTNEEYIYFLQHLPGGGAYAEDPLYPSKLRYIMSL